MEAPVWREDGGRVGTVTLGEQGGWTSVCMVCLGDSGGLFRGFLVCDGGELPLGVLAPEGQCLRVSRRFSLAEMGRMGQVRCGLRRLSYAFGREDGWQAVTDGFFQGREFRGRLDRTQGALWREEAGGRVLALPWEEGRPFPLIELLCFVRLRRLRGRLYGTIAFDREEWPRLE